MSAARSGFVPRLKSPAFALLKPGYQLILRIRQPRTGRLHHPVEFLSRRRFKLELADPYEIVELLFAHREDLPPNR